MFKLQVVFQLDRRNLKNAVEQKDKYVIQVFAPLKNKFLNIIPCSVKCRSHFTAIILTTEATFTLAVVYQLCSLAKEATLTLAEVYQLCSLTKEATLTLAIVYQLCSLTTEATLTLVIVYQLCSLAGQ